MKIEKTTKIGQLLKEYPQVKDFLINLNCEYKNLENEELFSMMKDIATVEMIAVKGGYTFEQLKEKIENFLKNN